MSIVFVFNILLNICVCCFMVPGIVVLFFGSLEKLSHVCFSQFLIPVVYYPKNSYQVHDGFQVLFHLKSLFGLMNTFSLQPLPHKHQLRKFSEVSTSELLANYQKCFVCSTWTQTLSAGSNIEQQHIKLIIKHIKTTLYIYIYIFKVQLFSW